MPATRELREPDLGFSEYRASWKSPGSVNDARRTSHQQLCRARNRGGRVHVEAAFSDGLRNVPAQCEMPDITRGNECALRTCCLLYTSPSPRD